jgi:hypothetical protein
MRIVLATHRDDPGTRACITGLHRRLRAAGIDATLNDWSHYERYDVAVFMAYDQDMHEARRVNPRIRVALCDPKQTDDHQLAAAHAADFLVVTGVEQREVFYRYNRNVLAFFMAPPMPAVERTHTDTSPVIVGYHGNRVHLECMVASVTPALNELGRRRPVEFWAIYNVAGLGEARIGVPDPSIVKVRHIQWSSETVSDSDVSRVFYDEFRHVDIGIVPNAQPVRDRLDALEATAYDEPEFMYEPFDYLVRFKASCNAARVYPFARLGIPVIGDFVPSANQVIRDGDTGFVAASPNGWFEALDALASSPDLRNRMADRMRTAMDTEYERHLRQFLDYCTKPLNPGMPVFPGLPDVREELARLDRFGKPKGASDLKRIPRRLWRAVGGR